MTVWRIIGRSRARLAPTRALRALPSPACGGGVSPLLGATPSPASGGGGGWGVPRARSPDHSPVGRLERQGLGDLSLPPVAVGEQFLLVVEQFLAGLGGEFEIRPLDDRIDRAGLLAIAAIDAFGHVDVVAGGAPAAILARLGLDRDCQGRADRLAQFAGDTAHLPIGIAPQHVLAAEPWAQRPLLIGVIDRDRAPKHVAQGQCQARDQLGQQKAARAARQKAHCSVLNLTIAAPPTLSKRLKPSQSRQLPRRQTPARTAKTTEPPSSRAASAGCTGSAEKSPAPTENRTS